MPDRPAAEPGGTGETAGPALARRVLAQHGLDPGSGPVAVGRGGTYPTFLIGERVVKLFPDTPVARASLANETAALAALAAAPGLPVPRLLASGALEGEPRRWGYLVQSRLPGADWRAYRPGPELRLELARALGGVLGRAHALDAGKVMSLIRPGAGEVVAACQQASLPAHLLDQIPDFLATHGPVDGRSLVHGDLMDLHVFVAAGALSGIIDWGDAVAGEPAYELAKLHLDLFELDKGLLAACLDAYGWVPAPDLAVRCLVNALVRQAHCVAQHGGCDVFHKLPGRAGLEDVRDLETAAERLFGL